MLGEWCYNNKARTKEQCEKVISLCLKKKQLGSATIGAVGLVDTNVRRSRTVIIEKTDPDFKELFQFLWEVGMEANDTWFKFHITRLYYFQFAEYDASYQGEFKTHQDVFWMNGDPEYHRKQSLVLQLSDPAEYSGGELEFTGLSSYPTEEQKVEMKNQGSVINFPAFVNHCVKPVTEGKRYSLCCWFEGPKWR